MYWGGASSLWNVPLGGPQALWESGQEAGENGLGLRSVTPGKPPTRGLASGLLGGLEWRPSLRICSTSGCVEAPVPPFPKGAVRQRESLELLRGRGRRSCLELCSGRGGEGGGLCCLDRWSGSQLGTLCLAEWRPECPQETLRFQQYKIQEMIGSRRHWEGPCRIKGKETPHPQGSWPVCSHGPRGRARSQKDWGRDCALRCHRGSASPLQRTHKAATPSLWQLLS